LKTTGIIVEYNPLHPGHIYHMEQARKQTGADYLIARAQERIAKMLQELQTEVE